MWYGLAQAGVLAAGNAYFVYQARVPGGAYTGEEVGLWVLLGTLVAFLGVSWAAGAAARKLMPGVPHPAWLLTSLAVSASILAIRASGGAFAGAASSGAPAEMTTAELIWEAILVGAPLYALAAYFTISLARASRAVEWNVPLWAATVVLLGVFLGIDGVGTWLSDPTVPWNKRGAPKGLAAGVVAAVVVIYGLVEKGLGSEPSTGETRPTAQPGPNDGTGQTKDPTTGRDRARRTQSQATSRWLVTAREVTPDDLIKVNGNLWVKVTRVTKGTSGELVIIGTYDGKAYRIQMSPNKNLTVR